MNNEKKGAIILAAGFGIRMVPINTARGIGPSSYRTFNTSITRSRDF